MPSTRTLNRKNSGCNPGYTLMAASHVSTIVEVRCGHFVWCMTGWLGDRFVADLAACAGADSSG